MSMEKIWIYEKKTKWTFSSSSSSAMETWFAMFRSVFFVINFCLQCLNTNKIYMNLVSGWKERSKEKIFLFPPSHPKWREKMLRIVLKIGNSSRCRYQFMLIIIIIIIIINTGDKRERVQRKIFTTTNLIFIDQIIFCTKCVYTINFKIIISRYFFCYISRN